jgi:hypothetical protein
MRKTRLRVHLYAATGHAANPGVTTKVDSLPVLRPTKLKVPLSAASCIIGCQLTFPVMPLNFPVPEPKLPVPACCPAA